MSNQTACQELAKRMDELAREYGRTKDQNIKQEIEELSRQLAKLNHLAVLEDALQRCRKEDMRTADVSPSISWKHVQSKSGHSISFAKLSTVPVPNYER